MTARRWSLPPLRGGRLMSLGGASRSSPAELESALWRALGLLRVLMLGCVVIVNAFAFGHVAGPGWLAALLLVMVVWTGVTGFSYGRSHGADTPLLLADLAVSLLLVLATVLVQSHAAITAGAPTVPQVWAVAAPLAWALRWGPTGGIAGGLLLGVAGILERGGASQATWYNLGLVVLAGAVVGYVANLARRGVADMEQATRLAAATAERNRLARVIHDDTLQLLSLVGRRPGESEADRALAAQARATGAALRELISDTPGDETGASASAPVPGSDTERGAAALRT